MAKRGRKKPEKCYLLATAVGGCTPPAQLENGKTTTVGAGARRVSVEGLVELERVRAKLG